jgi:hypothetical protein
MTFRSVSTAFVTLLSLLSACVAVPEYKDPMSNLNRSVGSSPTHKLSPLSLGLIYSENSQKALAYLKENHAKMSSAWANPIQAPELDPGRLTRAIDQLLGNRFGQVIRLQGLNDPKGANTDLKMVMDLKAVAGSSSFSDVSLDLTAIILAPDGKEVTRIKGSAKDTIPYPAQVMFGKVANKVMAQFQQALDGPNDLLAFANNNRPRPAPVASRLQAVAQKPQSQLFSQTPEPINYRRAAPRPDDVAVIIGNADYNQLGRDIPNVTPALADAEGFKRYVTTALGVKPGNIIDLRNATSANLVEVFGSGSSYRGQLYDWVRPGQSRVIIYYSGHGAPGQGGRSYLVPVDANAQRVELSGYPLDQLYHNLGQLPARSVTVVLEACFSGLSQSGTVVSNASPVFMKAKETLVPNKVTVIAAGHANQIASWEENKSHGLFTKYFLKAMSGEADENRNGIVEKSELSSYLDRTLTYFARRYYGRDQKADIRNYPR